MLWQILYFLELHSQIDTVYLLLTEGSQSAKPHRELQGLIEFLSALLSNSLSDANKIETISETKSDLRDSHIIGNLVNVLI